MVKFLDLLFWLTLSFMAMDYTLGRATLRDPLRAVLAAVFAVLFILFVWGGKDLL